MYATADDCALEGEMKGKRVSSRHGRSQSSAERTPSSGGGSRDVQADDEQETDEDLEPSIFLPVVPA